jgi:hypothetical protein
MELPAAMIIAAAIYFGLKAIADNIRIAAQIRTWRGEEGEKNSAILKAQREQTGETK